MVIIAIYILLLMRMIFTVQCRPVTSTEPSAALSKIILPSSLDRAALASNNHHHPLHHLLYDLLHHLLHPLYFCQGRKSWLYQPGNSPVITVASYVVTLAESPSPLRTEKPHLSSQGRGPQTQPWCLARGSKFVVGGAGGRKIIVRGVKIYFAVRGERGEFLFNSHKSQVIVQGILPSLSVGHN